MSSETAKMETEESSENESQTEEKVDETVEAKKDEGNKTVKTKKEKTPGVIYLSRIPTKMNVKLIREYFSNFGEVDRIYLEPEGYILDFY